MIAAMCKEDRLFFDTLEPEEQRLILDAIMANVRGVEKADARKVTKPPSMGSSSRPVRDW